LYVRARRTTWAAPCLYFLTSNIDGAAFQDYEYVYKSEDSFAYLGNDKTELDLTGARPELAPFIRNEGTAWGYHWSFG
jgi:hypothetical protein